MKKETIKDRKGLLKKAGDKLRGKLDRETLGLRQAVRRSRLKTQDFTIISNNCWGGRIYQYFGLNYQSPTVGTGILGFDYIRFCENLSWYMEQELEFIPWETSKAHSLFDWHRSPTAVLGDIQIWFPHYTEDEEARVKWERRRERIQSDRILFKLSQKEEVTKEEIEAFMELPLKNKICFSYDRIPGTVYVPELKGQHGDEYPLLRKYVNEIDLINQYIQ